MGKSEWSKESVLGRGPCKNKDTEGLRVFYLAVGLLSLLLGAVAAQCAALVSTVQHSECF